MPYSPRRQVCAGDGEANDCQSESHHLQDWTRQHRHTTNDERPEKHQQDKPVLIGSEPEEQEDESLKKVVVQVSQLGREVPDNEEARRQKSDRQYRAHARQSQQYRVIASFEASHAWESAASPSSIRMIPTLKWSENCLHERQEEHSEQYPQGTNKRCSIITKIPFVDEQHRQHVHHNEAADAGQYDHARKHVAGYWGAKPNAIQTQ
mmetsp:Transcript_74217/g.176808  ORF Transcript_74217/g.176808 Transcript_74217/m.176808 type:complete len:207 (-) Transcript_74217:1658-2278(-)